MVKQINSINALFSETREQGLEVYIQPLLKDQNGIRDVRSLRDAVNKAAKDQGKRTIIEMAENTFEKQKAYGTTYSFESIHTFIDNLFTKQSLKGRLMEDKAISHLNGIDKRYEYKPSTDFQDLNHNQDVIAWNNGTEVAAYQVKPLSYKYTDDATKNRNIRKMKLSKLETFFIYYDEDGDWSFD